ncbi:alpha/beta fold hydrolase [Streptomyces werraensis]|uniref:alpha/beta fold hydrolase n=1 Tax=Streptomyces werraensis TaxID=68284 RepID=UPI0037FFAAF6
MNASTLRSSRKRVAVVGVLTGAAALALANLAPAGATTAHQAPEKKPTVVLVHGAFADSSSWNGIVERLKKDGYPVVAPANPLRGLTSDADYVKSFLKSVKGPVVLAGHSYGGAVISKAAEGEPNVKALVYIAAFAPDKGESALELSNKYPGSTLGPTLNTVPFPLPDGGTGKDLYIKADKFPQQFAADVPSRVSDLMAATQRPVAASALEEPATGAAWKSVPSWNLVTTQDLNIPVAAQRFMAQRAHSRTTEIKASHAVTVSRPGAVTRIIEQAARATAGN